jgi:hypothetical protein
MPCVGRGDCLQFYVRLPARDDRHTIFGVVMGLVAGISLTIHGAPLDNLSAVNPSGYRALARFGRSVGLLLLLLAVGLLFAAGLAQTPDDGGGHYCNRSSWKPILSRGALFRE